METQEVTVEPQKKKRHKKKIILITLGVLVTNAVILLIFVNVYINRSLAQVKLSYRRLRMK
ncbi:hypothetical protein [Virgibacillus necropolis]|uniref:Uncharacterized protein n=1 Tax=Virgibacillus necropolis TaxID=163877 RepID=A0A221MEV3_9BACI|nr:hypothetical protein [Virgibacillus necropolis]ASN06164.1 hypothetical protein CFK40_14615 [Virgibacillus necropolis]